ncbi:MAG TPA: polymer-forming cytoskeletal protein [Polyangiaceae bacterium]
MSDGSVIGPGTVVRGNVRGEGSLSILGRVEGDVTISGDVVLGEAGAVRGNITATQITVGGRVLGDLNASETVLIESGARVVGDILAPRIGITNGALVRGNVRTEGEAALAAQPAQRKAAAGFGNVHRLPQRPTGRVPDTRATDTREGVARSSEMRGEARPFERARPAETRRSEPRVEQRPPPQPEESPEIEEETDEEAVESSPGAIAARSNNVAESEENGRERPPPPVVPVLPKGAQAKKKSRKR